MAGIRDMAKSDTNAITADNNGWAIDMLVTPFNGTETLIQGLHSKVHLGVDSDGNVINSKKATATISEDNLPFNIRNTNQEVDLNGYIFKIKDSTGVQKTYVVRSWMPDELLGIILIFLEDYEQNS